jgi:hypothetical protein
MNKEEKCARGLCNRKANPLLVHRVTGLVYCPRCAREINRSCDEEVIPWPLTDKINEWKQKNVVSKINKTTED